MSGKFFLILPAVILAGFIVYRVLISPASVTFENRPSRILSNSSSENTVKVFPVDRLGLKIPFVHLVGRFIVNQGKEKIDIVAEKSDELIFRTRNVTGRLVIFYYTSIMSFPLEIILEIESTSMAGLYGSAVIETGSKDA